MQAEGQVSEVVWLDGQSCPRVQCDAGLVPGAGQYVLAHAVGSDAPLATALFALRTFSRGFVAAPPTPSTWNPGTRLLMRGPLGHGFSSPGAAHRVALVAYRCSPRVLLSMLDSLLQQESSVTLVGEDIPEDLPPQVEAQPLGELPDVFRWADFVAADIEREVLPELRQMLQPHQGAVKAEGQILIRTPMPCGALADCGVCTVELRGKVLLACEDGPVFSLRQALEWSSKA